MDITSSKDVIAFISNPPYEPISKVKKIIECISSDLQFLKNLIEELFKERDVVVLQSLVFLTGACGLEVRKDAQESKLKLNMQGIKRILNACVANSEYFTLDLIPGSILKPFDWLEMVLVALLDVKVPKEDISDWLNCFRSLLKIAVKAIENNVTSILQVCIFTTVVTEDLKNEYCSFFKELISLYSRLHQLPNLIGKILLILSQCTKMGSTSGCISRGRIYRDILDHMSNHFQLLPFSQINEMWKMLSETYTTFANVTELCKDPKGAVFYYAQIFSTFLLQSKLCELTIPKNTVSNFVQHIRSTRKDLDSIVSVLSVNSVEVQPLQQSLLMLCFALGEIEVIYKFHNEHLEKDTLPLRFPHHPLDCSLLFEFWPQNHCEVFSRFLKSENKILSYLVLRLVMQKIEVLMHKKELSCEEKDNLHLAISTVLGHAEENKICSSSWASDLCALDDTNYGFAVWKSMHRFLPLVIDWMEYKDVVRLSKLCCDIITQNISSDKEDLIKSIVVSMMHNVNFQESEKFQTAVVSSIWKLDYIVLHNKRSCDEMGSDTSPLDVFSSLSCFKSKWLKLVKSTPKGDTDSSLNHLWSAIKYTCDCLNRMLPSTSMESKLKLNTSKILQIINCLPLGYLLPSNQLKCIVGLSALLFLVPANYKSDEALKLSEELSITLISIFDSLRSIWLFDFVMAGPYLKAIVDTLDKLTEMAPNIGDFEWPQILLDKITHLISIEVTALETTETYFSELMQSKKLSPFSTKTLLLMLKKLSQILNKKYVQANFESACGKLASAWCYTTVKYFDKYEEDYGDSTYSTLLECYAAIIKILSAPACSVGEKQKKRCLKKLPKILNKAKEVASEQGNLDVYLELFTEICTHHQEISQFLPEDALTTIWNISESYFLHSRDFRTETLQNSSTAQAFALKEKRANFMQTLLKLTLKEQLTENLENRLKIMEYWNIDEVDPGILEINLEILTRIIEKSPETDTSAMLKNLPTKILNQLLYFLHQFEDTDYNCRTVKLPILQFLNYLISQKKFPVPKQSLLQCLDACSSMTLQNGQDNLELFVKCFDALWNIPCSLLNHHAHAVLPASAVIVSAVGILLKSFLPYTSQEIMMKLEPNMKNEMILSAQNIDKLFTSIARHELEFSKLVPYLVADYVECIQHFTVDSDVKPHLLSGIHRLLDLYGEQTFKVTAVNISATCEAIYTNMINNYKLTKYQGDV